MDEGALKEIIECFEEAIKHNPNDFDIYYYSRTPLNPYLSVDGSGYGLLEVMGYEGSILV